MDKYAGKTGDLDEDILYVIATICIYMVGKMSNMRFETVMNFPVFEKLCLNTDYCRQKPPTRIEEGMYSIIETDILRKLNWKLLAKSPLEISNQLLQT